MRVRKGRCPRRTWEHPSTAEGKKERLPSLIQAVAVEGRPRAGTSHSAVFVARFEGTDDLKKKLAAAREDGARSYQTAFSNVKKANHPTPSTDWQISSNPWS